LELKPGFVEAHHNLGSSLMRMGRYADAAASFQRAIDLQPNLAETQWNLSTLRLLTGDFERGWPQYEWRWKTGHMVQPQFAQPPWDGQSFQGKTILLYTEQGLGDAIQFIRYAPMVRRLGANVLVACPKHLIPLLRTCPGIDAIVGSGDAAPPFDFHASLLSLPHLLGTT